MEQQMLSYMMPTEDAWFEDLLAEFKDSGKRELVFQWFQTRVTTLPESHDSPFFLYFYDSLARTRSPILQGKIPFRVLVRQFSFEPITGANIFLRETDLSSPKVWFCTDRIEELRGISGEYLTLDSFEHFDTSTSLPQAMTNSIAPVRRLTPMIVVQTTGLAIQD